MSKKMWTRLPMFVIGTAFLFVIACAHRAAEPDAVETQPPETQAVEMESEQPPETEAAAEMEPEPSAEPVAAGPAEPDTDRRQFQQRLADEAAFREIMAEDIYFDYNSSSLDTAALEILNRKAQWLMDHPEVSVIIEGHTDERRSNERNIMLGEHRAGNVKGYLISRGIDASRLSTVSYGEERPVAPGHTEAAWRQNRRVHLVINTGE